jgi:hypothetical protein
MRKGLLASALLGLGLATTAVPATARADDWHRVDERRHVVVRGEYAQDVAMWNVPGPVRDRVNEYRHGRHIQRAQFVRQDGGAAYYRFRIGNGHKGDFYLNVTPYGRVLGRTNVW